MRVDISFFASGVDRNTVVAVVGALADDVASGHAAGIDAKHDDVSYAKLIAPLFERSVKLAMRVVDRNVARTCSASSLDPSNMTNRTSVVPARAMNQLGSK